MVLELPVQIDNSTEQDFLFHEKEIIYPAVVNVIYELKNLSRTQKKSQQNLSRISAESQQNLSRTQKKSQQNLSRTQKKSSGPRL